MQERTAPTLTDRTRPFWTGGSSGELLIQRCRGCGRWAHPPMPLCASCHSRDVAPEAVSGLGKVWSFTINRYPWSPGIRPPYLLAEVELEEQPGLRLLTSIVDGDEVTIGMAVSVRFEPAGETWIPVFAP